MTISFAKEDSETDLKYKTGPIPELEILRSESLSDAQANTDEFCVRFSCLDNFYAAFLTRILKALPEMLYLLTIENYRDRLRDLAKAHLPDDWYVERDIGLVTNGYRVTLDIFNTVPMFTADEVLAKNQLTDVSALKSLQKFRYRGRDFFPADQFGADGKPLQEYSDMLAILREKPNLTDWELALWWINPTGWLSGFAPRDLLLDTPDEVRVAAEQHVLQDLH